MKYDWSAGPRLTDAIDQQLVVRDSTASACVSSSNFFFFFFMAHMDRFVIVLLAWPPKKKNPITANRFPEFLPESESTGTKWGNLHGPPVDTCELSRYFVEAK